MTRHEYQEPIRDDEDGACFDCGLPADDEVHADPADDLPEELTEAAQAWLEATDDFVRALHRAGARDSDVQTIRHFAAYHLADLEGNDNGAGWLARGLMADEVRSMVR